MSIMIRKAVKTDYEQLKSVLDESDNFHLQYMPYFFQDPEGDSWKQDYILKLIENEGSIIYLAIDDNNVVGAMVLIIKTNQELAILKRRTFVMLDIISIKKEYQNKGIGKKLLFWMENWANENRINELELNVYEFNSNAIKMYEKLGFITYSRRMHKHLNIND
jgi:ribosomal protein S18 acetylase RimI-like enzyme